MLKLKNPSIVDPVYGLKSVTSLLIVSPLLTCLLSDSIIQLINFASENELMNKRKEVEDFSVHREQDLLVIKELEEYIHKLEHDKNNTLNESANLEEELAVARVSHFIC